MHCVSPEIFTASREYFSRIYLTVSLTRVRERKRGERGEKEREYCPADVEERFKMIDFVPLPSPFSSSFPVLSSSFLADALGIMSSLTEVKIDTLELTLK